MIEVQDLVKKYGEKTVLDHVSFSVGEGEVLGFLGPNGAGKSTTMNILTGNLSSTEGRVMVDGAEILESPLEVKRKLGYLPEQPPLYPEMTVDAYLHFVYRLKKCRLPREEHLREVCEAVQIEGVRRRVIRNLSKGYRQRIGIAQALIGSPPVLIFDEPTVGLDPKQMVEIRNLVRKLGEEHTVILSSHILSEVQAVCDRVIVINHGKLIADDTPENLTRGARGDHLRIRAEGPEAEIRGILKDLEGVRTVKSLPCAEEGCCDFEIEAADGRDLRRPVAARMKKSAWLLLESTGADQSLESIFLKLTDEGEGKGGERP